MLMFTFLNQMKKLLFILNFVLFGTVSLYAQFDNTMQLDSLKTSPPASLTSLDWIAGCWEGEAFGGRTEEVWSRGSAGSMMGMFKLYDEKKVIFYELMTISEEDESLILRIKHFGNELKGWEEKDESIVFKLVKIESKRVYFSGLTFEKVSETGMNVYVVIHNEDDSLEEVKFTYSKCKY